LRCDRRPIGRLCHSARRVMMSQRYKLTRLCLRVGRENRMRPLQDVTDYDPLFAGHCLALAHLWPPRSHGRVQDWRVRSSEDLITWVDETTIVPGQTFMGNGSLTCWAVDVGYSESMLHYSLPVFALAFRCWLQ